MPIVTQIKPQKNNFLTIMLLLSKAAYFIFIYISAQWLKKLPEDFLIIACDKLVSGHNPTGL